MLPLLQRLLRFTPLFPATPDDDRRSTPPPAATSKDQSYPTTIDCLSDDILLEIFLRLPSLATLIRAAVTCRAWLHAVASSPSFRRRFRALHRAPLLGLFADPECDDLPVFLPVHHRDRDVLAAIGRSDFALTPLLDTDEFVGDVPIRWRSYDCRDGYLLLMNREAGLLAAINPLSRCSPCYIDMPSNNTETTESDGIVSPIVLDVHLVSSDEDPMSFRLISLVHDESRVRAAVFSSDTCHWSFLPWVEIEERAEWQDADDDDRYWLLIGTQANGFLYWLFRKTHHVLRLDTTTMEFSVLQHAPHLIQNLSNYYIYGNGTPDGAPCIVYCTGMTVGVLIYGGADSWIQGRTAQYKEDADDLSAENNDPLKIIALTDGFAYLATSKVVVSLCLETMQLEKLLPRSFYAEYVTPYVMAWPPCLIGNNRNLALIEDVTTNAK